MTNMDWENQLKDGPYDAKAKQIHLNSIQKRISTSDKKQSRLGFNRLLPITLFLMIIAGGWIFSNFLSQQTTIELKKSLSDYDILQIIAQSYPDPNREMLYQENIGSNNNLIFTKKIESSRGKMTWEVGYINGVSQKWVKGGELEINLLSQSEVEEGLKAGYKNLSAMYIGAKEGTPFPILFGSFVDPKVTQIRISAENGYQQAAKIVKNAHGGYSLWYALLPDGTNSELKLEYMDRKGKVIENYQMGRKQ
jgi:hypothetical protein